MTELILRKYIFDVDGTLTPSRGIIDKDFKEFFMDFCYDHDVYLVTGSDRPKTVEQLGNEILDSVKLCFNCAGNEIWQKDTLIEKNSWSPSTHLLDHLNQELETSKFPIRTGNHIEHRTGMINFSIVGRNANREQRSEYVKWDTETNERHEIADRIRKNFRGVDPFVGGETGLDIFEHGGGKQRSIRYIKSDSNDFLYYFGDQIVVGGNDYDIAKKCNIHYNVSGWRETKEILNYMLEANL